MRISKIRALRGPNLYSIKQTQLIVLRLDLERDDSLEANQAKDLLKRLNDVLGLENHLREELEDGFTLTRLIEVIALELQYFASMQVTYSRTEPTIESGIFNIVFSYEVEEAGLYAGEKAVSLLDGLLDNSSLDALKNDVDDWVYELRLIREEHRLGPSSEALISEAARRGIPSIRLDAAALVQLGYGRNQQRISASITENTRVIAVDLAGDKYATKELLDEMSMPVPKGRTLRSEERIEQTLEDIGFPVAIKPLDANQGKGITTNINSLEEAVLAFRKAQEHSSDVIIETSLTGFDFRVLVVDNKLVAAARRDPAHVIGDGKSTIEELIDLANENPLRGIGHENVLTKIEIDDATQKLLSQNSLGLDSVLDEGEYCALKTTANLSTGGTATDVTDEVHPYNVFLFERIAHFVGLDVGGIDVVAPDLSTPLNENGGGVVEVNAAPGLRMHLAPSAGTPRNVAEPILDMLFPPGSPHRIPIIAMTGTNGKTTTVRLIAHLIKNTGKTVGFTTSDGVYVGNYLTSKGDTTGPLSAQMILKDPDVDVAVLETARGGILRAGLGFDYADIGILTNVAPDHLGQGDIHTVEDIARLKSVVPESARDFAILNADDPLIYEVKDRVQAKVALFSMQSENPRIEKHLAQDGLACVLDDDWIVLRKGRWSIPIEKVIDIPLTLSGRAKFNVQNVLAATLAAYCYGLKPNEIKVGLNTFAPSIAQTPGRLNVIDMQGFTVLIDYAHNAAGMAALRQFVDEFPAKRKTVVIGGTGDRRDVDIVELGTQTAEIFDDAIIREDDNLRGRAPGETADLVIQGIKQINADFSYERILNSKESIEHALSNAKQDDLIAILGGNSEEAIDLVGEYRERSLNSSIGKDDIPNMSR
ncbi:MAG: cyanophycin synthetase [Pseudomonadota bacterium]